MPRKSAAKAKTLTIRDMSILTDLARCRVLSLEQVKVAFWPSAKERTCRERLEQLEKAGYIASQTVQGDQPGASIEIFYLANKGKRWATGPDGPGLDRSIVFETAGKADEIIHQVRTNDVYFTLSKTEQATWRIGDALEIERGVFQGGGVMVPDALYIAGDGGEVLEVLIETDCGSYTAAQIREKIAAFSGKKSVWICPSGRDRTLRHYGVAGEIRTYGGDRN
jgi:DNA-binding Lrp family transcriptional regulator